LKYRDAWLTYRNLGHVDANGAWVAPISFVESQQLPKAMLNVFFELDNLISKMQAKQAKKNKVKKPR